MTEDEQLELWRAGTPVHNYDKTVNGIKLEGGECCPDFSCCTPELLAEPEEREAFYNATDEVRHELLFMFLGKLMKYKGLNVNIVDGSIPPDREH